ncbi:MAG TPA: CBS domain-containing protein [Burkholderiales bacterium]|nr:CBS domain-containing protein [Burkholderiales bacterium]
MTQPVVAVAPETPVRQLAALMLERRISGVPVTDAAGRVLGVVSEGDFIRRPEIDTDLPGSRWLRLFTSTDEQARDYIKTHGRTAADIMTAPAVTVTPEMPLAQVARMMSARRVKRVPVVEGERLVGIVTRADLLRAVYRHPQPVDSASDGEIHDAVIAILEREDWAAGAIVQVRVADGRVELWGSVESDRQREALVLAAGRLPGVSGVDAHLTRLRPG